MTELARVLDPAAHDALTGPHGTMSIELPGSGRGEQVTLVVPRRLACARCDGGGCDSCGRSGALLVDLDDAERTIDLVLPEEGPERFRIRLVRPLGERADLEQLTVEVRLTGGAQRTITTGIELRTFAIAAFLALAAAIVAGILHE